MVSVTGKLSCSLASVHVSMIFTFFEALDCCLYIRVVVPSFNHYWLASGAQQFWGVLRFLVLMSPLHTYFLLKGKSKDCMTAKLGRLLPAPHMLSLEWCWMLRFVSQSCRGELVFCACSLGVFKDFLLPLLGKDIWSRPQHGGVSRYLWTTWGIHRGGTPNSSWAGS